jgi:hypothetical protein
LRWPSRVPDADDKMTANAWRYQRPRHRAIVDGMHPVVREILGSFVSSAIDSNAIHFRSEHERGGHPVHRACKLAAEEVLAVTTTLNRNAFLCGFFDFTEHEPIDRREHKQDTWDHALHRNGDEG